MKTNQNQTSLFFLSPTINNTTNTYINSIKIGLLNTRGLNENTKLKCLLEYTYTNNYTIFDLSETKIKNLIKPFYNTNNYITQ